MIKVDLIKKVAAIVLIVLTSGTWFYLDYLNKQEQLAAVEIRKTIDLARAQARARAAAKAKFEAQILADLTTCQATAEKAKNDYITLNEKPVRRKPGQFTIPQAVADEAAKMLATSNAECQATHDTRLRNGS